MTEQVTEQTVPIEGGYTREELLVGLQEPQLTVKFIKKSDGSERTMRCTLNREILEAKLPGYDPEAETNRKVNPAIINVYDLEAEGWRSFAVASVIRASVID